MKSLDKIFDDISQEIHQNDNKLPPVEKWHPPLSGDIDIRISRTGQWFHEGDPIHRHGLVKVFSSILKREGNEYFLVTPVEKWRIQVEDVPFSVSAVEVLQRDGVQALVFSTATGEKVIAGPENPLRVVTDDRGEPSPYVLIRNGMEGLLARPVFYQLADIAVASAQKEKAVQGVYSLGEFFPLE